MRVRGFEVVQGYEGRAVLPLRSTAHSAGYDITIVEDLTLPGNAQTIVSTGLRAYMPADEFLAIHIRSGLSQKGLVLTNGTGIVDAEYCQNGDGKGHILLQLSNLSSQDIRIKAGESVAQGIFQKYLVIDGDSLEGDEVCLDL